jgi:hypothetical protein
VTQNIVKQIHKRVEKMEYKLNKKKLEQLHNVLF